MDTWDEQEKIIAILLFAVILFGIVVAYFNFNDKVKVDVSNDVSVISTTKVEEITSAITTTTTKPYSVATTQKIVTTVESTTKHVEPTTKVATTTTTAPAITLAEVTNTFFNTPLSDELDAYIVQTAQKYGITPQLIAAIIDAESDFVNLSANSDNCVGYMQVCQTYTNRNMYNQYENIDEGSRLISQKLAKYGDLEMALIAYNEGDNGAQKYWFSRGIYSNSYSQEVIRDLNKY